MPETSFDRCNFFDLDCKVFAFAIVGERPKISHAFFNGFFFLFLDDELFSDTYKVTLTDNVLYEVVGKVRNIFKIDSYS